MSARPYCTHRHGTRYRNMHRSCHERCTCTPCRAANNRYQVARNRNIREGKPHRVPTGPLRELIADWRSRGFGPAAIAAASGLPESHIKAIAAGKYKHVLLATAEALQGARPDLPTFVDSIGTRRRLRALAAIGFPMEPIAAEVGAHPGHLEYLTYRYRRGARGRNVTGVLAAAVAKVYDDWCTDDGARTRSDWVRAHARKRGCLGPEVWTDETIDDPKARPWQGTGPRRNSSRRINEAAVLAACAGQRVDTTIADRREIVRRLHADGLNDHQIARLTGISARTVLRIRGRLELPANERADRQAGAA